MLSTARVTLAAGAFAWQDLVSLKARHRRGWRVFVGDEKEAALSVADRGILAPEPGRVVMAVLGVPHGFMRGVFERIFDHGDRDLPVPSLLLQ